MYCAFPFFRGYGQHDASEFLKVMIDRLQEALKRKHRDGSSSSFISDVFQGSYLSTVTCFTCHSVFHKEEEFTDLPLPIPSRDEIAKLVAKSEHLMTEQDKADSRLFNSSFLGLLSSPSTNLYDCLMSFCHTEQLENYAFYCENCKAKVKSEKVIKIKNPPEVLAITIKRFHYNGVGSKISTKVNFPRLLDLEFFLLNRESIQYDLTCVIQHIGSVSGGHYVAYCKNEDGCWRNFNDSIVKLVTEEDVVGKEAYVLFYTKSFQPPKALEISGRVAYVPSEWLVKYYNLSWAGQIRAANLLCKHGNLKPQVPPSMFSRIPRGEVNRLWQTYKADCPPIERADNCDDCKRDLLKIAKRLEKELKLVEDLNEIQQFEGPWHLISSAWVRRWKEYMQPSPSQLTGILLPPPIDNSILLTEDGLPKPNLMKTTHYRAVNRHVWAVFQTLYGGGPEILRNRLDIYAAPVTEKLCSTPDLSPMIAKQVNKLKVIGDNLMYRS